MTIAQLQNTAQKKSIICMSVPKVHLKQCIKMQSMEGSQKMRVHINEDVHLDNILYTAVELLNRGLGTE